MRAILTYQGFRETAGKRSGTEDLWWGRIREIGPRQMVTCYHPREWTSRVQDTIKQLARQGIRQIALVSYSHGQAAATAAARAAYEHNIEVPLWLACDPVYRPTWAPRNWLGQLLSFRALAKTGKIRVPNGVNRVVYVRQKNDRPMGHELVATNRNTFVKPAIVLDETHRTIDSAKAWHDLVEQELKDWLFPPAALPI